jgi:putative FmdB family regulatory protein
MPTYEYKCRACGYKFEVLQKITDDPLLVCPKCEEDKLKRVIGAGLGVIFKGSGFYTTDYKRSGANGSAKKSEKGESGKGESGKTEKSSSADSKSKGD